MAAMQASRGRTRFATEISELARLFSASNGPKKPQPTVTLLLKPTSRIIAPSPEPAHDPEKFACASCHSAAGVAEGPHTLQIITAGTMSIPDKRN